MKQTKIFAIINKLDTEQQNHFQFISHLDQGNILNTLRLTAIINLLRRYWWLLWLPGGILFILSDKLLRNEMVKLDTLRLERAKAQNEEEGEENKSSE